MNRYEYAAVILALGLVGVLVVTSQQRATDATRACRQVLRMARTRADSITVLTTKMGGITTTCAERLAR